MNEKTFRKLFNKHVEKHKHYDRLFWRWAEIINKYDESWVICLGFACERNLLKKMKKERMKMIKLLNKRYGKGE